MVVGGCYSSVAEHRQLKPEALVDSWQHHFSFFPLSFQRSLNSNYTDYLSFNGSLSVFRPGEPHTSSSNQQQIERYIPRSGGRSVYASVMRNVF